MPWLLAQLSRRLLKGITSRSANMTHRTNRTILSHNLPCHFHFTLISPLPPQRQFQKRTTNKLLENGLRTFALCGKEPFVVRPQSDKAGALPAPSRIVLRKVISLKMSVYRDQSDRRRERFAWRLTQSAVDEENVTAVARSAISDGACNWRSM